MQSLSVKSMGGVCYNISDPAAAQHPTADDVLAAVQTLTGQPTAFADLYDAEGQKLRADEPTATGSELSIVFTDPRSAELVRKLAHWQNIDLLLTPTGVSTLNKAKYMVCVPFTTFLVIGSRDHLTIVDSKSCRTMMHLTPWNMYPASVTFRLRPSTPCTHVQ